MTRPRRPSKLDDDDYPAYTIGLAADLLGVQPAFLRSLDAARLLTPNRSVGGQRRYSRAELTLALRVRELLDVNMPLIAAIRIVSLSSSSRPLTGESPSSNRSPLTPQAQDCGHGTTPQHRVRR